MDKIPARLYSDTLQVRSLRKHTLHRCHTYVTGECEAAIKETATLHRGYVELERFFPNKLARLQTRKKRLATVVKTATVRSARPDESHAGS